MLRGDENMAKVEQCPGFETFGADVKTAREKLALADFEKQLAVHNRRSNNLPMRPLHWLSPSEFFVQYF